MPNEPDSPERRRLPMPCPRRSPQEWSADLNAWFSAFSRLWFWALAAVAAVTIGFLVCRLAWWAVVVVHKALGG